MIKSAFAVLATAPLFAGAAMAGPYVMTKSEFKFVDEDYSKMVNQARVGYETKTGNFAPYVEVGGGALTPEGGDTEGLLSAEVGTGIKITNNLSAKAKVEAVHIDDVTDWKVEIGTKYKF